MIVMVTGMASQIRKGYLEIEKATDIAANQNDKALWNGFDFSKEPLFSVNGTNLIHEDHAASLHLLRQADFSCPRLHVACDWTNDHAPGPDIECMRRENYDWTSACLLAPFRKVEIRQIDIPGERLAFTIVADALGPDVEAPIHCFWLVFPTEPLHLRDHLIESWG